MRLQAPEIKRQVKQLITDRELNEQIIQNQLTMLMNVIPFGVCMNDFLNLFDYYHQIYPRAGEQYLLGYINTFREIKEQRRALKERTE